MAPEKKERKRKEAPIAATSSEALPKKLKKQKVAQDPGTLAAGLSKAVPNAPGTIVAPVDADVNQIAIKSKKDRKRAADFLSDNEEADALEKSTKTTAIPQKKAKKHVESEQDAITNAQKKEVFKKVLPKGDSLTADGVNGVVEYPSEEEVKLITANKEPSTSMQAEAQRTVDKEMADEMATEDESDDQVAGLLAGFDSDGDDSGKDEGLDPANMGDLNLNKQQRKKLRQAAHKGSKEGPGAVYVGRIPRGFYEAQMRQYFSQFGTITNLRLSRNKTTGASKHFAFVEFESNEVAKIVAQTMDNYLMFGHILKCKYAPSESLHPDTWKGANKRFKKVPYNKIEKRKLEEPKTRDQWEGKIARVQGKREKALAKAQAMGYDYDLPRIQSVDDALERKRLAQHENEAIEPSAKAEQLTGAIKPPNGIAKDAVALKKKNSKKMKTESVPEALPTNQPITAEPLKTAKKTKKGTAALEVVAPVIASEALTETKPEVAEPVAGKKAKKTPKGAAAAEAIVPPTNGEAQAENLAAIPKPTEGKTMKKQKKGALGEAAAHAEPSSSTSQPEVGTPKFAFHPDEIAELTQKKSKKAKKVKKGTDHAAVQIQLNTELNEAAEPVKDVSIESDTEIAATAAVLPTPGGGEKKVEKKVKIQAKKEKRKADALPSESAEAPKKAKKMKKPAA